MKQLWLRAQKLARVEYEEQCGEGSWEYADKHEREDLCMSIYEELKKASENSTKLNKEDKIMNKRDERMETLKVNGIEVGKYFDVTLPGGATIKMTLENGVPVVADNDPIMNQIIKNGYVRNSKLHRRWVMAQMFKMLNYKLTRYNSHLNKSVVYEEGYDACLRNNYGYQYQFDMMLEEIRVISKLEKSGDVETFRERTSFFNYNVVAIVCQHYMNDLKGYIDTLPKHKCKGVPYKKLNGRYGNVFESDLQKKVYYPMESVIRGIANAQNYHELYKKLKNFMNLMIKLPYNTAKSKAWIDAFKGSGSFYTLLNLTMYHNCKIVDEPKRNYWSRDRKEPVTYAAGIEATNFVKSKLDEYKGDGWRYMAMLRKCIADNNFSFDERMKEIYK